MYQEDIAPGMKAAYLNGYHLVAGTGTVAREKRNANTARYRIMDGAIAVCFHHDRESRQGDPMGVQCAFDASPTAGTWFPHDEGCLAQLF